MVFIGCVNPLTGKNYVEILIKKMPNKAISTSGSGKAKENTKKISFNECNKEVNFIKPKKTKQFSIK